MDYTKVVFLLSTVVLATLVLSDAAATVECIKDSHNCLRNSECCSGCCVEDKCVKYSDSCVQAQSPCAVHACPPGKKCYLQTVQCIQAACPPIPACKDEDYDDYN
ncbi:hypothetical protein L9F63_014848 [Diploptera punctata]|uniref:Uncharacterized protein n=1 Tax=Diploptera punctata TaxID=6984 RepID=A0AAD8EKX0_DIPPU|nr:hypothetical protein L9F63_014848 [Diploptera punctata]